MYLPLFRRQAVDHQLERLHGSVLVLPSLSHVIAAMLIAVWLLVTVAWLVNSQYARQVTVSGWLEPPEGVVRMFPQNGQGRLTQVYVQDGQHVTAGQPLFVIGADRTLVSGDDLEARLLREYQQQQVLLEGQLQSANSIHQTKQLDLSYQLDSIQQDLARLASQMETLEARQALIEQRVGNYRLMSQDGHIAAIEVDKALEQKLALQSEYQMLQREYINQKNQQHQLKSQRDILPQQHINRINEYKTQISLVDLKIAQLSSQQAYVVKATRSGKVANLQVQIGQQVLASTPILSILPNHQQVEAKLLIPARSAGFIRQGQHLDIRYDAFPFQKFGIYRGVIAHISQNVLLANELDFSPLTVTEPVYLVTAMLSSNQVHAYGKDISLKSGMTLSADIELGQRSLFEWLLEPLFSLQGRL